MQRQQGILTLFTTQLKSALKASYKVVFCIACSKKAFTIAEELILPSAIDMYWKLLEKLLHQNLNYCPSLLKRQITEMSDDIECQLLEKIKSSLYYSIQLNEFTNVSNEALLPVFVRCCADGNIHNNLLFCKELPTKMTADEIIHCLDNHFTFKGINWMNYVGVCTDGAASITGIHCGVVKQILERAGEANKLTASCTVKI